MKDVVILGVTGSIGVQTLEVIEENSNLFQVTKVSIGNNVVLLDEILSKFKTIKKVALLNKNIDLENKYSNVEFYYGEQGILDLIDNNEEIVLNAILGFAGLAPSIKAIETGCRLALANKETMVVAGHLIKDLLKENPSSEIIPVDSEHNALFQCLKGNDQKEIKRLILTASGGSFRDYTYEQLQNVSIEDALNHPNWNMGASITIDSATMLNKGLEVIEAYWLFDIDYDNIDVVIHKESIIHSMIEYSDNSILAQLSYPSMKHPISYALHYPKREVSIKPGIDFKTLSKLHFDSVDDKKFKGLKLAYLAGKKGHSYPCVLNASKEVATSYFLDGKIKFLDIVMYVEKALEEHVVVENASLKQLIEIDRETRIKTKELIEKGVL